MPAARAAAATRRTHRRIAAQKSRPPRRASPRCAGTATRFRATCAARRPARTRSPTRPRRWPRSAWRAAEGGGGETSREGKRDALLKWRILVQARERAARMMDTPSGDPRLTALAEWLRGELRTDRFTLSPASEDASFRRYFRVAFDDRTLVAMDAPPPMENCRPFVHVARLLHDAGVHAPEVHARDLDRGFLLLEDLGSVTYLARLGASTADALYLDAIDALIRFQRASREGVLPRTTSRSCAASSSSSPTGTSRGTWVACSTTRSGPRSTACSRACSRTTWHSRACSCIATTTRATSWCASRIRACSTSRTRCTGPSPTTSSRCLRDAYIDWDEERQIDWAVRYWERARAAGIAVDPDFGIFWRDFEWMGVQRQIKVLGIFARLCHRDGKAGYVDDMPLVMRVPARRVRAIPRARADARTARRARRPRAARVGLHVLAHVCDADRDDPCGRSRRAHAAADRHDAEAAARRRRQAAHRVADRGARTRGIPGARDQRGAPRRRARCTRSATASRYGVRIHWSREPEPLETGGRHRHRHAAVVPKGRSSIVSGDVWTDFDYATLRARADTMALDDASPRVHLVMVPNPAYHPEGDFALEGSRIHWDGPSRLTFGNIGVYDTALFRELPRGDEAQTSSAPARLDLPRPRVRRALRRPLGQRGHSRRARNARRSPAGLRPQGVTHELDPGTHCHERQQSAARLFRPSALRRRFAPRTSRRPSIRCSPKPAPPSRRVATDATPPSWESVVEPLADVLDRLDRAWGAVRHLNAVVNTPELRDAYNANLPKVIAFFTDLAQDLRLYARVSRAARAARRSQRSTPRSAS